MSCLQILLLTVTVLTVSGVQKLTVTPDRGTTLNISSSSSQGKGCKVCTGEGRARQCTTFLVLKDNIRVSVEFDCTKPQDVFTVTVVRDIECTTKSCSGHIIQADSGSLPLLGFTRTFTWNLKASAPKAFKIDFTNAGLRQINPSERCPDGHTYTLQALQTTGKVAVGKYCRTGTIRSAQILNAGSFSLDVPAGQKLQNGQFDVSVGEEIKSLAKITLALPKGTSSSELLSPNFPGSFPDDDVMEWYFQVLDKHKTTVEVLNLTQPRCRKKDTAVEYHTKGRGASVRSLAEPQLEQNEGNFSLTLRNCEMDRRSGGSLGLSLKLRVSSSNSPVSCQVDMSKMERLALHIEKLRPASDCLMKINSETKENITVTSNSYLTFLGCLREDVRVTATRVIECSQLQKCQKPESLSVPPLPSCLPFPLSSVTWTLRPPPSGTVELASSMGLLKQSLPKQLCNGSFVIKVAEEKKGAPVGSFCHQGAIQTIQIDTNVSVTVFGIQDKGLAPLKNVLRVTLKGKLGESYIFTVSPKRDTPVFVATPGWPGGMQPYSTVTWLVSVPQRMEARLMFDNISQPKCEIRHTSIKVQRIGRPEEDVSRREDEMLDSEIIVSESFFLNMSNCMPESGEFSVVTKITLQKSKNLLLAIILSVVAALLVIFVIVLVVVCVVIRKKKKKLNHDVSIYNPNGTVFLPGQNGFPETHEDDTHEYATIEDTLVYTHLLKKGKEIGVYGEFDRHHTDSQRPLVSQDSGSNDAPVGTYQNFQLTSQPGPPLPVRPPSHCKTMVENEIYPTEEQSEEERSPNLGPRMEPEGGN